MKISKIECLVLGVTAAALLVSAGYFFGWRSSAQPYRVDVQYEREPALPMAAPTAEADPVPAGKININTATAQELETLPGIGERRAQDIVADRAENGPFRIPEDLTRVKGIGEGTLEGLLEYITVE